MLLLLDTRQLYSHHTFKQHDVKALRRETGETKHLPTLAFYPPTAYTEVK